MKGRSCHGATFDSYREMLAHCRQKHPDSLPFGGEPTTELVVTDTQGNVLSWQEIRQIVDDPSFWREPPGVAQREEKMLTPSMFRRGVQGIVSQQDRRPHEIAPEAIPV
ncbi:MAG TPA: hypothetical protein VLK82_09275 [Candidatus Tectomicrobia bacterium]|nr:hypothetical protein [Candidatus Tectomicrobia bacterium]